MAGNTPLLFGCIGLSSVLLFGPGLVLLDRLGWEAFELPGENTIWTVVLVCLSVFFAFFFGKGFEGSVSAAYWFESSFSGQFYPL